MSVKVENVEKNVVQLEFEVEPEKFEEGMQKSFLKNVKKFNVPGFRKGKAPRKIIERYYGEQVFYEDAINFVCSEAYDKAVEENELQPVDQPDIDIKQIGSGEKLIFTAKVTVKPEVVLGEYKGIEVEKPDTDVTDKDVDAELDKMAQKNARLVAIDDRAVELNDIVNIDFAGSIDGVAFEGGTAKGYDLTIGSGHFIPGFEDQLIGAKLGEEVNVNVQFPEDYSSKDLAGKSALFVVNINRISVKQLPTIDDEFAKDVSEFDTLEEYKESIKKELRDLKEKNAKREFEDKIISKVAENAELDIPSVMIDKQLQNMLQEFDIRLKASGLDIQTYLNVMNQEPEEFIKKLRDQAEKDIRAELVLEKISKNENIVASDDDVNEELKLMAEKYDKTIEDLKKDFKEHLYFVESSVIKKKTIEMLIASSKAV